MPKQTILVVDDEEDLLEFISYSLRKEGYDVLTTDKGETGIKMAGENRPDLILLDIMMPGMNGIEVCRVIKQNQDLRHIPVVFLTAKMDEKIEVQGLDLGADDYLPKPISTSKLKSRIKAVLRRYRNADKPDAVLSVHELLIDRDRYVVTIGDTEHQLPKKEFELLYYLASRKGKVLDRQTLLNEVWGNNIYVIDRTVDVHIRKIREKIGEAYIETVKGVGYRFRQ
ncbi:two-component system, OmpR family, alkaline phosphatase synthesis response regulator PhoP [Cyclonatronum proteinivorum]|uniref:Phosphate regulon transcriptional regulatory protein PhoB n=1 Tax=Cyclonatronum proteinivorum TaxID=1457365 RepID=A0A345UNI7_9BACT|nr:response regulator transcription factor [Cyclonatronum proteinivorum]AXJ02039.1 two-component system, OmpR family, alkaline phosphatase synthesis response regulator PhoP [Cyclonatronum proteinivorum]